MQEKKMYMWPSAWDRPSINGTYGAISSNNAYATQAGLNVLRNGGNAFDAAVAVSLVLSVVEPHHSGIGGGCFTLAYSKQENAVYALDGRGIAPRNATKDLFLKDGKVCDEWKDIGGRSVAVPGLLKSLDVLLKKFGTMTMQAVAQDAIKLSFNGFRTSFTGSITGTDDSVIRKRNTYPAFKKNFMNGDKGYEFGAMQKNEKLGRLLEKIATVGVDYFYSGEAAKTIINTINEHDGCFSYEDMSEYQPKFREPVSINYRNAAVYSFPPPGGGCTVLEMLNILENADIKKAGHNSAQYIHLLAEAMKIAFADRSIGLGDPDFIKIDTHKILSKDYAKLQYEHITKTAQEYKPGIDTAFDEHKGNTSHFSIMDRYGNTVSQTQTIRDWFGSGIVVDAYGFVLNNAMSDFSATEGALTSQGLSYGSSNAIAGGKTPISSMSPTIVFKEGAPFMAIGSAGGPRIITGVLQGIVNAIDFDMEPEQLVDMPYINCLSKQQGIETEFGISPDTVAQLQVALHTIHQIPVHQAMSTMVNCVMKKQDRFYAGRTKRVDGCAGVLFSSGASFDGIGFAEI